MKTLILSTFLFLGFGFSAEGQPQIALHLCKDCMSHLMKLTPDSQLTCVESSGQPLLLFGDTTKAGLKLGEMPTTEQMQKELRSTFSNIFPLDLVFVEVVEIEQGRWDNSYWVHCENQGLRGIIGVNLVDTANTSEPEKLAINELELIISRCEGAVIQKENGFECAGGSIIVSTDEVEAAFQVDDTQQLNTEQLKFLIEASDKLEGELLRFEALSAYSYKVFTKLDGEEIFYGLTVTSY